MNQSNGMLPVNKHIPGQHGDFLKSIVSTDRVSESTHTFYRYPARFSPMFVQEAIKKFSEPGNTILDPFMGGGTTIVEGMRLGRNAIGSDINQLSYFVTSAKTCRLNKHDREEIDDFFKSLDQGFPAFDNGKCRYLTNLNDNDTNPIRCQIENYTSSFEAVKSKDAKLFLRCALLNVSQWALDCRADIPSPDNFKEKFLSIAKEMLVANMAYFKDVKNNEIAVKGKIFNCKAEEIGKYIPMELLPIKLIITSPPYPGGHVLYHRWQVKGRKETAVPYYIANCDDGMPGSYYTFGPRKQKNCATYFENIRKSYSALGKISDSETTLVQMLAFSEPSWQLPEYLSAMGESGFREIPFDEHAQIERVWRDVPGRKWYARSKGNTPSSREVVLIHKKS